jgi:hypothetical protein
MRLNQSEYVLGYTDREQLRLIRQARVLAPVTEHFLRDAGIGSGMRAGYWLRNGRRSDDHRAARRFSRPGRVHRSGSCLHRDCPEARVKYGARQHDVLSSGYLNLYERPRKTVTYENRGVGNCRHFRSNDA